ncbi:DUF4229 domain-containing protein [Actinoplanes sp. NPDC048796]|uniref:DUF4229 domain-containing protein n=1 Tax=unclassified Actinoplanes TaxID=2626549 RepID=UPI0033D9C5C1
MNPAIKYSLGRLGLFVVVFAALLPVPLNFLVRAMVALVVSAVASYFLLASWRNQMNEQLVGVASRRTAEKQRLRAALAGDEDAALAGDRAAPKPETAGVADATVEDGAEGRDQKADRLDQEADKLDQKADK